MALKKKQLANLSDFDEQDMQQVNNAATQQVKQASVQQNQSYMTPQKTEATQVSRRAKRTTIPRSNGCTYYIEDKHIFAIDRIKCFNRLDKQDVVRTAIDLFLKQYMKEDGMGLTDDGVGEVEKYMSTLV